MKFRTRYLIQPKFQLMFSGLLVLIALIFSVLVGIMIYYLVLANNSIFVKYQLHSTPEFLSLLNKERSWILLTWVLSFSSVALILFIGGIFLSHKMAGPMFAFIREMQKLKEGDLTAHLTLRKRDEFKELKAPFNLWIEKLRKMTEQDIDVFKKMTHEIAILISQMKNQNADEKDIYELKHILDQLNETIVKKEIQLMGKN